MEIVPSDPDEHESVWKWLRRPQTLIALSAVLLSVCGLFVSLYEASLIREQQRASVWPHVQVGPSFTKSEVAFHVQNVGVGPARIQAASIRYQGEVVPGWQELFRRMNVRDQLTERIGEIPESVRDSLNFYYNYVNGNTLPPDSNLEDFFRLSVTGSDPVGMQVLRLFRDEVQNEGFDLVFCYCSVYDQCWVTSMRAQGDPETTLARSYAVRPVSPSEIVTGTPRGTHPVENCAAQPNGDL